jgi:tetratricopeptide (TPR) repeat protein
MNRFVAVLAVTAAAAACAPLSERPHTQAQWLECNGESFSADRAGACSAVIGDRAADASRRAIASLERGRVRAEAGEHARAIADFGRALRLNPRLADALTERGIVHADRGAYEIALRDYDAALALSPNDPLALHRRELALQGRVDAVAAEITALTEALVREPMNADLLNNRCWVRAVAGRELDAALIDCDRSLAIRRDAATFDSRALVHLKRGDFSAALGDYETALAIEPGDGHYLYGRGLARRALGMNAEAHADFTAGERARPGVAELYRGYGV